MQQVNLEDIRQIIGNVIGNIELAGQLQEQSMLLGAIPEIDSMGVINLMLGLEVMYGFHIEDDEVEAEVFETVGSLRAFAQSKLDAMSGGS